MFDGCGIQGQTDFEVASLLKVIAFLHLQSSSYLGPRTPRSVEFREYIHSTFLINHREREKKGKKKC